MKKGKEIFKIFSIFASFIFFLFISTSKVEAIYNVELNKVLEYKVDRANGVVTLSLQYQYGIKDLEIFICSLNSGEQSCAPNANNATAHGSATKTIYVDSQLNEGQFSINRYNDLDTYSNGVGYSGNPYYGKKINEYTDIYNSEGKLDNNYTIMVKASFCTTRNAAKDDCLAWTNKRIILKDNFNLQTGLTNSAEFNTTLYKALNITNSIVIPVLWVILFVLLIVRGIMLAIDIVKSSDEPEIRKKKINGMIWLVVGVLLGYAVTISASIVMEMFGYGGLF